VIAKIETERNKNMLKKYTTQYGQLMILILLTLALLASLLIRKPSTTQAGSLAEPAAISAPSAPASPSDYFTCTPGDVAVFTDRVHIRCTNGAPPGDAIYYFAVSTADSASAGRFLSIFTTAKVTNKTVAILYDPNDTSGESWGCLATNCRVAYGAVLEP
jgi:hypothetical protein